MAIPAALPVTVLEPQVLDDDPRWLLDLEPAELVELMEELDDDECEVIEHYIAGHLPWRSDPASFAAHLTAEEPTPYQMWRHTALMSSHLARAATGEEPHQIHMIGSQYGKTTLLMWFILWMLDRDPTLRIMYVSYDADRAVDFGGDVRDLVVKHREHLRFSLRTDQRAKGKWETPQGGGLYCVGILGGITGFPQDAVLCDDLFKGWEWAHSPAQREKVWNIYTSQVRMRLQAFTCPVIHVGTRWHEDDMPARLMKLSAADENADRWVVLRLPTFAEAPDPLATDPLLRMPDPLGRLPGELLCPERFPLKEALARKAGLAMYLWAGLEQQRPAPLGGTIFKRAWWQLDLEDVYSGKADTLISSWDMKLKNKKAGDYVVGQVWARTGKDLWLLDQIRGQFDQPTVENAVALMMVRHPKVGRHYMENTGTGPEVMDALRTAYPNYVLSEDIIGLLGMTEEEAEKVQALRRRGMPGIIPVNPKGDKVSRAIATTGAIEAGDVHLPAFAPWLPVFLEEMSNFSGKGDAHDDIVDACTQAISKLHKLTGKLRTYADELQNTRASSVG
jgi:phage terminase large subunit-like protein